MLKPEVQTFRLPYCVINSPRGRVFLCYFTFLAPSRKSSHRTANRWEKLGQQLATALSAFDFHDCSAISSDVFLIPRAKEVLTPSAAGETTCPLHWTSSSVSVTVSASLKQRSKLTITRSGHYITLLTFQNQGLVSKSEQNAIVHLNKTHNRGLHRLFVAVSWHLHA